MNKADFISEVCKKTGLSKKDYSMALDATLETITETLIKKDSLTLIGFGIFSTTQRAARKAKVPGSDKIIDVPATTAVKFKVGKKLKESVATGKKQ